MHIHRNSLGCKPFLRGPMEPKIQLVIRHQDIDILEQVLPLLKNIDSKNYIFISLMTYNVSFCSIVLNKGFSVERCFFKCYLPILLLFFCWIVSSVENYFLYKNESYFLWQKNQIITALINQSVNFLFNLHWITTSLVNFI